MPRARPPASRRLPPTKREANREQGPALPGEEPALVGGAGPAAAGTAGDGGGAAPRAGRPGGPAFAGGGRAGRVGGVGGGPSPCVPRQRDWRRTAGARCPSPTNCVGEGEDLLVSPALARGNPRMVRRWSMYRLAPCKGYPNNPPPD